MSIKIMNGLDLCDTKRGCKIAGQALDSKAIVGVCPFVLKPGKSRPVRLRRPVMESILCACQKQRSD